MKEILTATEVCEYLNITKKTLAAMRKRGEAPKGFRLNDAERSPFRYLKTDVDQWINEKRS